MAAMLIPKFKWNWADANDVPILKELFKKINLPFVKENISPPTLSTSIEINNEDEDDFLSFDDCTTIETSDNADESIYKIIQEYSILPTTLDTSTMHNTFLRKAFIKYNTAVPSSAHVERLFSAGGQLLSERRGSISDHNFEKNFIIKVQ